MENLAVLPLIIILIAWMFKRKINNFYMKHLSFFNNTWVNVVTFGICTTTLMIVQFRITLLSIAILLITNISVDTWLILKSQDYEKS